MADFDPSAVTGEALVSVNGEVATAAVVRAVFRSPIPELLDAWLSEYRRPNTKSAYRRDLLALFDWCALHGIDPLAISRPATNAYRNELAERGLSLSSVARKLSSAKSFYRYLLEEEIVDRSPFQHMRRLRPEEGEPSRPWLDQEDLRKLLEAAKQTNSHGRDFVLVALLGLNGLRVSEALGAQVEDLSESGGYRVLMVRRKGGKTQAISLAPVVAEAIDEWLDGRGSGPILVAVSKWGNPQVHRTRAISASAAHRVIKRLAALAGVNPAISPHGLRRSFVTLALANGAPLHIVQSAVGHSNPATTMIYARALNTLDENPTFALSDAMLGGEG
jgi:site-specific recombinase XerD